MSLDVSSWFVQQTERQAVSPLRHFTIGGSDYSAQVLQWPKLAYKADTIDLGTVALRLSNRNGDFRFFVDCGLAMTTSCELSLGFAHTDGSEEQVSLYVGEPAALTFSDGGMEVRLQLQGKTKRLTEAALGTDTDSGGLDFTGSDTYPADLVWTLVTCYGGLSPLASAANPDIDYARWEAWRELNVIRDVRVRGFFSGQKVFQVLNTMAFMDSMVILFRNAKLDFTPLIAPFGTVGTAIDPKSILDMKLRIDPSDIRNEFSVETDYDRTTRRFRTPVTQVNSASRLAYGRASGRFGSQAVWFATPNDGRYLAEDVVRFNHEPAPSVTLKTPLAGGVHLTVGDVVTLPDSVFSQRARTYRIAGLGIDMGRGSIDFQLETANQRPWHFVSVVSSLNLRVRTVTRLDGGVLLAGDEAISGRRIYRTDSAGMFQPLPVLGTAIAVIGGQEVLVGGPPSSGSFDSVLRRSSDAGSSAVTVSSLSPSLAQVYDLFRVNSAVFLAATSSGGIWRSSDAGSSWALTMAVSPGYHVHRFFEPWSGTLWAGTGYDVPAFTAGAHIWQSDDAGVTWGPKHTVIASGDYHLQGFFAIGDTEFLASTQGADVTQLRVLRSAYLSPSSIGWVSVLEQTGFSEAVRTSSGHILFGHHEELTLNGGTVFRSLDSGSSWVEDARISKKGNVRLMDNGDGTVEAFTARIAVGQRTDRHRNYDPNRLN